MPDHLDLEDELVALGRTLVTEPPGADLATLVLARLDAEPPPVPQREAVAPVPAAPRPTRVMTHRLGWAAAAVVVLVLALVPPVRAAVVELLRIGGIVVREVPTPAPTPSTTSRATGTSTSGAPATPVTLGQAEHLVGADIGAPTALGPPTSVTVTHDGRVAELVWGPGAGTTRLDVFVGSLSWGYLKTVWEAVTPTTVADHEAVWLGSPHLVEWVDRVGGTHSEPPRLAGPTLVWVVPSPAGDVTYRLEGVDTLTEALRVARSAG
ncbi:MULTISPECIES: hypothetical protein [unclassified Terrabacter]|uniref:hypothetical protein n=1 Tax=unclassified Terrabacter TaxID=2630222 RepID=UPI0006FA0A9F|nr:MULTISPECIES: hypothetical protein [unclassified Terrabacter]KRB44037.1 hypothetical protein ASD90_16530 [Terrabacter sp. Root181]KRF39534.1 hypothetical protein ASG96_14695 [Terrabacter sp. Soil810]